jgi:hypothetical protein
MKKILPVLKISMLQELLRLGPYLQFCVKKLKFVGFSADCVRQVSSGGRLGKTVLHAPFKGGSHSSPDATRKKKYSTHSIQSFAVSLLGTGIAAGRNGILDYGVGWYVQAVE